MKRTKESYFR